MLDVPTANGVQSGDELPTGLIQWIPEFLFDSPAVLWWLIVPTIMLLWVWMRSGRRLALPVDYRTTRSRSTLGVVITLMESTLAVILAIVIFILAGPLRTGSPIRERRLTNIEFCVDCSGSMTAKFGEGDRYDASMKSINEFVALRKGDAFGLTFFATDVIRWCPLTRDASAFQCALPFMKPDSQRAIGGGTMIARAVQNCRKTLMQQENGDRMIVLVSDGASADLYNGVAEELGRELKASNISLFAIHVGGDVIPEEVTTMATSSGGNAFVSGNQVGLEQVFARIDGMKPVELETVGIEYVQNFQPFCVLAGVVLTMWSLGSFGLRYNPW
jgi:Ca-activated chloride channel family protein